MQPPHPPSPPPSDALLADARAAAQRLEQEVGSAVIGQTRVVRLLTIALFARGHVLLEGDVGVGKTTLLRAFARAVGGEYARVEGTVDLMPNDLIYYTYVGESGEPRVDPGPLLQHGERLVSFFFNEINRARPQVHSLLLRVMAERSVQAFNHEVRFPHLTVFADRNRVEREETFEIASAARDRFMFELPIGLPEDQATRQALIFDPAFHDVDSLIARVTPGVVDFQQLNALGVAIQTRVKASDTLVRYALALWEATRDPAAAGVDLDSVDVGELVLAGASPRGMSMLLRAARVAAWLDGRDYVVPEDIRTLFQEAVGHRVFFQPIYELRRAELAPALMQGILQRVPAP